jgi:DNA-binding protein H-NS
MPEINLQDLSLSDLKTLSEQIDDEINYRSLDARKKAAAQIKELAASVGMTVEELAFYSATRKSKGEAKYQNPADLSQTWSGRGKRPGWVKVVLEQGGSLDSLRLPE